MTTDCLKKMEVYIHRLEDFLYVPVKAGESDKMLIKKSFNEKVCGNLIIRYTDINPALTSLVLMCCDCKKAYKLKYSTEDVQRDVALNITVTMRNTQVCKCLKKTPQIRGKDRASMMEILKHVTPSQIKRNAFAAPRSPSTPPPPPIGTLNNILHEMRGHADLDTKDPINDIFQRYLTKQINNISEVSVYNTPNGERFRMILTTDHAIETLQKFLVAKNRVPFKRLLLDATGKITAPVMGKELLHHVLLAPIPKHDSDRCFLLPVGEMVTNDHTGENIGHFLRFILNKVSDTALKRLRQIGTDDSWANVHAIFSLTPGMSVTCYLKSAYEVFKGNPASKELLNCIAPAYCFSHFSKNWKNDIIEAYGQDQVETRNVVRSILTEMTTIGDPVDLERYIRAFIVLLSSELNSKALEAARSVLGKPEEPTEPTEHENFAIEEPLKKTLFRDSPFFQHFNHVVEKFQLNKAAQGGTERNKFFSESLLQKILKHYLAYLPFWTIFIARQQHPNAERSNNGRIERFFRSIKDDCEKDEKTLTRLGNIKIGRYAAFRAEILESLLNEIDAGELPSRVLTNQRRKANPLGQSTTTGFNSDVEEYNLSQQQEQWSKKRRTKYGDFSRRCLEREFED